MTAQPVLFDLPVTAARCQSISADDWRCSNNAATYMRVACVHEHVWVVLSCTECVAATKNRTIICGTCRKASEPHECALIGQEIDQP